MIKVITYYLIILSSTPSEYFPKGQTLILPFENEITCQLAVQDLIGFVADNQCQPSIMREVLKMTPPNVDPPRKDLNRPLPRPKAIEEITQ